MIAPENNEKKDELAPWQKEFNNLDEKIRQGYVAKFVQAEQLFQQKRVIECLRITEDIEKLFNGNPGLYNLKGACYIEIREVDKAVENFKKALAISPENSTFEFNLAECYFVSHDYKTAIESFKAIRKKMPENTPMFIKSLIEFKLYISYLKTGQEEEAKKMESLYGLLDDVPYYYCVKSVKAFHNGNRDEGNKAYISAANVFLTTPMLQPYIDAMQESGFVISSTGQTTTEQK